MDDLRVVGLQLAPVTARPASKCNQGQSSPCVVHNVTRSPARYGAPDYVKKWDLRFCRSSLRSSRRIDDLSRLLRHGRIIEIHDPVAGGRALRHQQVTVVVLLPTLNSV